MNATGLRRTRSLQMWTRNCLRRYANETVSNARTTERVNDEKVHEGDVEVSQEPIVKGLERYKDDDRRAAMMTMWRRREEDRLARRLLPVPVSLTGLGDGTKPRYWRYMMTKALMKLDSTPISEAEKFIASLSPTLTHIFETSPELVTEEHRKTYDKYLSSKQELKEQQHNLAKLPREQIQLPFSVTDSITDVKSKAVYKPPKLPSGLIDQEYDSYLKHQHLLQHIASNYVNKIPEDFYKVEVEAWRDELWRRNYGTPDPDVKPSNVPCVGCGAHLHCTDHSIPGYIPSEKYKVLTRRKLRREMCQRCEFLKHFNISLNVNVSQDDYPAMMKEIEKTYALVILMVDLTDFPSSIWPDILSLIGKQRKIYVVGNKVDLLPKDSSGYLQRVEESLKSTLHITGVSELAKIRHVALISAKTGFGVEQLVTKLLSEWNGRGDIILIGSTNVGKSTLFNALLQSDLCASRSQDIIQRATTSVWPGTTLNLLKFPIVRMEGWKLKMRMDWLHVEERKKAAEARLQQSLVRQMKNPGVAQLPDRLEMNFRNQLAVSDEPNHPFGKDQVAVKPFSGGKIEGYDAGYFFYDTPGAIYKDQILPLLTTEELLKTIPRETIVPRTFTIRPFQTLFLAGLGRIDLVHATDNVWLTVFASHYLPIHIVYTEEAKTFYDMYIGTDMLGIPCGGQDRLKRWPPLSPIEVDVKGITFKHSAADIVLSSAGWVAVTAERDHECVLRAFTPGGRGLFVRRPCALPFAVNLKGRRIKGTPCYRNNVTYRDIGREKYMGNLYGHMSETPL